MSVVYLGLGSNLGKREKNLNNALFQLEENGIDVLLCSTIIETEPVGGPIQGKYLNAVVKAKTIHSPIKLLTILKTVEKKLGRTSSERNGPRIIDLDILLYDHISINTPELTIPHPRMWDRQFILTPLKEIAPEILENLSHASH